MSSFGEVRQWSPGRIATAGSALDTASAVLTGLQDELDACSTAPSWSGSGATAASADLDGLTRRLRRLVAQAAAVRTGVRQGGQAVHALRRYQDSTESFAAEWGFVIGNDGAVTDDAPVPPAPTTEAEAAAADAAYQQRLRAQAEIIDRVEQIMRTAADVDADLTGILLAAHNDQVGDGMGAGLGAADVAGASVGELSIQEPPPRGTAADNAAWWNTYSGSRQAQILAQHPDWVGNLDGIPAQIRSTANQARLPDLSTELATRGDELRARLAADPSRQDARRITEQLAQVMTKQDAIRAIERVMAKGDRQLLLVDASGDRTTAAVAVGNVDTADHVAVSTPGFNSTVAGSFEDSDEKTALLKRRTEGQLGNAQSDDTVAAITWLGYEPPVGQTAVAPSTLDPDNLAGMYPVVGDEVARQGAVALSSFYNGIDASRDSDPHLTALGHSYGSLTTSLALQTGTGVDDVVLYGSPGLGTDDVTDLGVPAGHVFVEEAKGDWIADAGAFGADPSALAGVTMLATDARVLPDGTWGQASNGHSAYQDEGEPGDPDYRRTTATYNQASIVAGMPERAVRGFDLDGLDTVRAGLQVADDAVSWTNQMLGDPGRFLPPVLGSEIADTLSLARGALGLLETGSDLTLDRIDDVIDGVRDVGDGARDVGRGLLNLAERVATGVR